MNEEISVICGLDFLCCEGAGAPETFDRSPRKLAQDGFELGEGLLDGAYPRVRGEHEAVGGPFGKEFNVERPHKALAMKMPAEVYSSSVKPYNGLPDLAFPLHDRDVLVTACGLICLHRKRIDVSTVLAGQRLGIKEIDERTLLVSFMSYDLGFVDLGQKTSQPLDNPFGPRLSPMS